MTSTHGADGVAGPHGHVPVLLDRVLGLLAPALGAEGAVAVDTTLGAGGHAEALLAAHPGLHLVGLDRDPAALARAGARLAQYAERTDLVHAVYDELPEVLADLGRPRVQGVLMDLGVSSMQLDEADRGFAYAQDAPLDMRMDPTGDTPTAADVLNGYAERDLARLLRDFGEERFAQRVAAAVVRERAREPFTTSARLVDVVRTAIPAATRRTGGNPAKRTFQALRIEVNRELEVLADAVPSALDALAVGGRLVVLAYHSLEDRIVKRAITPLTRSSAPVEVPVERPEDAPVLRLLVRSSEGPTDDEIAANPRAASVRLRAVERLRTAA